MSVGAPGYDPETGAGYDCRLFEVFGECGEDLVAMEITGDDSTVGTEQDYARYACDAVKICGGLGAVYPDGPGKTHVGGSLERVGRLVPYGDTYNFQVFALEFFLGFSDVAHLLAAGHAP